MSASVRERALARLMEPPPGRIEQTAPVVRRSGPVSEPAEPAAADQDATRSEAASREHLGAVERTVVAACAAAPWVEDADAAAVAIARRIARDLDRLEPGDSQVSALSRSLERVLTSLQLTPAGRRQAANAAGSSSSSSTDAPENPLEQLRRNSAARKLAEATAVAS